MRPRFGSRDFSLRAFERSSMAGAWVLVALAEWAADRAERQRTEAAFGRYGRPEGPWFATPTREGGPEVAEDAGESGTRLPPPAVD